MPHAQGGAWSAPETVAAGKDWFVNWADFPSVAVLPDGALFAHWLRKSGPANHAYDVRVSLRATPAGPGARRSFLIGTARRPSTVSCR